MSDLRDLLEQWMRGRTIVSRAREWADELVVYLQGHGLAILPIGARELTYLESLRSRIRVLEHQVAVLEERAWTEEDCTGTEQLYSLWNLAMVWGDKLLAEPERLRNELAASEGARAIAIGDGRDLLAFAKRWLERPLTNHEIAAAEALIERVALGPLGIAAPRPRRDVEDDNA